MKIPFSAPSLTGKELFYLKEVLDRRVKTGYSDFKTRSENHIRQKWGYNDVHLTSSCTSALEIAAILTGIKPGDEVIIPSWTFPSTANAFIRQGASIILADSSEGHPGIDEEKLNALITSKTKAIVPVHYAGVACNMDKIMALASKHNLYVIEDAAHGIGGYYNDRPLGSIGNIGCLSFHRTKDIQCIEGGALIINDRDFSGRVMNIIEKGTDRQEFIEGRKDQYEWVDLGSSFGMSELHAAYLYAQLEVADTIKLNRKKIWDEYYKLLLPLQKDGLIELPYIPEYAMHNAHIFYILMQDKVRRDGMKAFLAVQSIESTAHYVPLHRSRFWLENGLPSVNCENSLRYSNCILRLPLYNDMTLENVDFVVSAINEFFGKKN